MKMLKCSVAVFACLASLNAIAEEIVFEPGHPSLQSWLLPEEPPHPENNEPTPARVALGEKLFFEERLSHDGDMSCATCHSPELGWSDGLPTARGFRGMILGRATPTVVNTAYNGIQMWDGREPTLESQALGPMKSEHEMNIDLDKVVAMLKADPAYAADFAEAYPGEPISEDTVGRAIASFERTIISRTSPFDQWVQGDATAMTADQVEGFKLFVGKAKCDVCHSAPNFTDDGFHNLGLPAFAKEEPDLGRFAQVPLGIMKGAFKTPTLRDVELTAPYFHDGSADSLLDVIEHYAIGGEVKTNLSPNMEALDLTEKEKQQLVDFMLALTSPENKPDLQVVYQ